MLTKQQKVEQIKQIVNAAETSGSLLFADFAGVTVNEFSRLRRSLGKKGAKLSVVKKRLLKIALRKLGIETELIDSAKQGGVVFIPEDIMTVAGLLYKFGKEMAENKNFFQVFGGYDRQTSKIVGIQEFVALAKLPSRETLLSQLAAVVAAPICRLAAVLKERSGQLEQN